VRWRKTTLASMTERIVQMGLSSCNICGSTESLRVNRLPVILSIGGPFRAESDPKKDKESNILIMVGVVCDSCGHTQLFDSERIMPKGEAGIWVGEGDEPDE